MKPAGLKNTGNLHSSGRFPAIGSSGPGLSKGQPPSSDSPVVSINVRLGPNGLLMRMLGKEGYATTVVRTLQGEASAVCRFPRNWIIDPLLATATPTIEIVGVEGLSIECELIGIRLETEFTNSFILRFRPRPAYVLNTDRGLRGTWPAVRYVNVHTGTGMVALANSAYDPSVELYGVP